MNKNNKKKICLICGVDCYDTNTKRINGVPITMQSKRNVVDDELIIMREPSNFVCKTCDKKIKDNFLDKFYISYVESLTENIKDNIKFQAINLDTHDTRHLYLFYKYNFMLIWLNSSHKPMTPAVRQWLFDNTDYNTPIVKMPGHEDEPSNDENTYSLNICLYTPTEAQNFFTKYEYIKETEKGAYSYCNLATLPIYVQLSPAPANTKLFDFERIKAESGINTLIMIILDEQSMEQFVHNYEITLYEYL